MTTTITNTTSIHTESEVTPGVTPVFPWRLDRNKAIQTIFTRKCMRETPNLSKVLGFVDSGMGISFRGHRQYDFATSKFTTEQDQMVAYKNLYNIKRQCMDIGYTLPAHKWGRIIPADNLSLSIMHRPTRHAFCKGKYVDIDMENAHPALLSRICKQHHMPCINLDTYVADKSGLRKSIAEHHGVSKDIAKQLPLMMMFGGEFREWVSMHCVELNHDNPLPLIKNIESELSCIREKIFETNPHILKDILKVNPDKFGKPNKTATARENARMIADQKKSVMGLWCQTIERFIQESCILWLVENTNIKLETVVPCQDGFMIPVANWYDNIIADIERNCTEVLGFDIKWARKEFDEADVSIPDGDLSVYDAKECLYGGDDKMAAAIVIKNYPHWVYCEEVLYVFDNQTGIWSCDPAVIRRIIFSLSEHLVIYRDTDSGAVATKLNYGTNVRLANNIPDALKTIYSISDNDWLRNSERLSAGCLLFNNGWLDMRVGEFHTKAEFDPKIVFFAKISRDYEVSSEADEKYKRDIIQRLFYSSFEKEMGDYCILTLARALAGDIMKRALFGLGPSNTGKGVLTNALTYSCGGYVDSFNAEAMVHKANSSNDEAQRLRWAFILRSKRIIISNEVRNGTVLDGSIFKRLTGGDPCSGRTHGGEETSFLPSFTMLMLSNDVPKFDETNEAIDNRIRCIKYEKTFVNKPASECDPLELPADANIKVEINTESFKRCFLQILIDRYVTFATDENGKEPSEPDCVRNAKSAWFDVVPVGGITSTFISAFKVTRIDTDYVRSCDVEAWLNHASPGTSMKMLSVEVERYYRAKGMPTIQSKAKKIRGRVTQCWLGVRMYREGENADTDEFMEEMETNTDDMELLS